MFRHLLGGLNHKNEMHPLLKTFIGKSIRRYTGDCNSPNKEPPSLQHQCNEVLFVCEIQGKCAVEHYTLIIVHRRLRM